jgi:Sodium/hydrogen exchanger family
MALEESSVQFIHLIISLAILLFVAKLFAELFHKLKLPVVLGELLAGIIVGPFAVGGLFFFDDEPLVAFDQTILNIGEISAVVILFVAGLEITPREFLRGGVASFTVGSLGVILPFFCGIYRTHIIWARYIRIYAGSNGTYCDEYCYICTSIDRVGEDADKRSQIDIRCRDSRLPSSCYLSLLRWFKLVILLQR